MPDNPDEQEMRSRERDKRRQALWEWDTRRRRYSALIWALTIVLMLLGSFAIMALAVHLGLVERLDPGPGWGGWLVGIIGYFTILYFWIRAVFYLHDRIEERLFPRPEK